MNLWNTLKPPLVSLVLIFILAMITACSTDVESDSDDSGSDNEAGADESFVIRFHHSVAEEHPTHLAALEFKEKVEERSEGHIEVEMFPNAQLYSSEREGTEAVQLGSIEMISVGTPVLESFEPNFSVLNLPYLFASREQAYTALNGELGNALNDMLPNINLIGLGYSDNGFRHFLNNVRPVNTPEDIAGLELRVIENRMYEDMFTNLGANATPMGFGETYSALQQGVYDGMDSEIMTASQGQLTDVLDHLTLTNHTFMPKIFLMNNDFFESLPEDLQDIVVEEGNNANILHTELTIEQEQKDLEIFEEELEIVELTTEQQEVFRESFQPIFDEYAESIDGGLVELARQGQD